MNLAAEDPANQQSPSRGIVLLLAVASACAVANLYYAQPLLASLGRAFHVPGNGTGIFVTLTQVGYACGLFFLVPIGDRVDRRRLILAFFGVESLALVVAAMSTGAAMFAAASAAIGVLSVSAQIIVPYAAHMAPDQRRGRTVGTVMSGLLLGILCARTLSGFVSHTMGWRAVFLIGAVLMVALAALMWRLLPPQPASAPSGSYVRLLASVAGLFGTQQVLRRRALYGACVFASFSVFWTGATFLLAGEPYHYSDAVIGLFGLCGVAGALSASFAGRLSDRGLTMAGTGSFLFLAMASFALSAWGSWQLAGVILGTIVLDLGVQGTQILNQSQIYQLGSAERSRLTAAYMTPYFLGGAAGSATSMLAYRAGGWTAVCAAGAAFAGIGFLRWLVEALGSRTLRHPRR
jgi:predicted MFS family arabinose efflux permease